MRKTTKMIKRMPWRMKRFVWEFSNNKDNDEDNNKDDNER